MILYRPSTRSRTRPSGLGLPALVLCVVLAAGPIGGCKEEAPRPTRPPKKIVSRPDREMKAPGGKESRPGKAKGEAQEPAKKAMESPVVGPRSKRDPFRSFVTARSPAAGATGEAPKVRTPLQQYSLDQLKVVGILTGPNMRKALLEDDAGKGYTVQVGDAVGSEGGRITAIKKDRVIIDRVYRDVLGEKKVRRVVKKLYTSEEGENP